MDNEEDVNMLDAYGDYYREGEDADSRCSDGSSSVEFLPDEDVDDHAVVFPHRSQGYKVLSEEDIRRCQESDIQRVISVLSVSEAEASILLRSYKWDVSSVQVEWFDDEEKVRRVVGLLKKPVVPPSTATELMCEICFNSYLRDNFNSAACGHLYCTNCWRDYISAFVSNSAGSLMFTCPDPSCIAAIGQNMIDKLASDDDKKKYDRFFISSYVEDSKETKWCPAPGCDFAIIFSSDSGDYDVTCRCSHTFCWNCSEEPHSPVDCVTAADWFHKIRSESENITWIIVNTKPCPRCKRPIENDTGCMYTQCSCKHEFCWLCLSPWSKHSKNSGGYNACNSQEQLKTEEKDEQRWRLAKMLMETYHEPWLSNQSSMDKAIRDLEQMRTVHLKKISNLMGASETDLSFITDAWLEIIKSRRFIKWTYVYGYNIQNDHSKREFFEYLQEMAKSALEELQRFTEVQVMEFCDDGQFRPSKEAFARLQSKLTDLTRLTKKHFENLDRAIESGQTDVESNN